MDDEEYYHLVMKCLMTFQYLEEMMKQVLIRFEALIYIRIKDFTPYNLTPKFRSIENAAMGRLIDMLSIYCDDPELIAKLKDVKKTRNELAHQGFLMAGWEGKEGIERKAKAPDLEQVEEGAAKLIERLGDRWENLEKTLNAIAAEQRSTS
jgi:hypothetical protein